MERGIHRDFKDVVIFGVIGLILLALSPPGRGKCGWIAVIENRKPGVSWKRPFLPRASSRKGIRPFACLGMDIQTVTDRTSEGYGPVKCTRDSIDFNFESLSNWKVSPSDFTIMPLPLRQGAFARIAFSEGS